MNDELIKISAKYSIESIFDKVQIINRSKSKVYSYGEIIPYLFEMFNPVTKKDIDMLYNEIKQDMPSDFIRYLNISNGLRLTADTQLCNIQEILQFKQLIPYKDNIIVFGTAFGAETHFLINLNQTNSNCIYITEPIGHDYAYSLNCCFTEFLSRYISCYGADFWNWAADYKNKIPTKGF